MEIHPVETELFHTDRRTGGQRDMTKRIVDFPKFADAPKNPLVVKWLHVPVSHLTLSELYVLIPHHNMEREYPGWKAWRQKTSWPKKEYPEPVVTQLCAGWCREKSCVAVGEATEREYVFDSRRISESWNVAAIRCAEFLVYSNGFINNLCSPVWNTQYDTKFNYGCCYVQIRPSLKF